jgi:MTH538 TIR-like domain (DUF1863)
MAKWEDYVITKLSYKEGVNTIHQVVVHEDFENHIGGGMIKDRQWLVDQNNKGVTFCCAERKIGGWSRLCLFERKADGGFNWNATLPKELPKRKTFLSFYHKDDEQYRKDFEALFPDLIINKCVEDGDIDTENSDEYIKKLIQNNHLEDTTVLIVLVGLNTKCRKHVDWEISGALNLKVGDKYAGLLGILLPEHPDYGPNKSVTYANLPARYAANFKSGYAKIMDWTEDRVKMQNMIEEAFANRENDDLIVNAEIVQMTKNTCS